MPEYRRYFLEGGTFFFTVVTDGRRPILTGNHGLLRRSIQECRAKFPFTIDAMVLLPEHLHAIWTLPVGDDEYPKRWAKIKRGFTESWLAMGGRERAVTRGRSRKRYRGVWQPRYWEHAIRNETDFLRHMDYIHYNPVKHGHVQCPHSWPCSSFHRLVREGVYEPDWGCICGQSPQGEMDFTDIEHLLRE